MTISLKWAIDQLAAVRESRKRSEAKDKILTKFVKANMSGVTAYGEHFAAQLTKQIRLVLDQTKLPPELVEKAKVKQEVQILNITAR